MVSYAVKEVNTCLTVFLFPVTHTHTLLVRPAALPHPSPMQLCGSMGIAGSINYPANGANAACSYAATTSVSLAAPLRSTAAATCSADRWGSLHTNLFLFRGLGYPFIRGCAHVYPNYISRGVVLAYRCRMQ